MNDFEGIISELTARYKAPLLPDDRLLRPALVIGVGEFGKRVLERFWKLGETKYARPGMSVAVDGLLVYGSANPGWEGLEIPETDPASGNGETRKEPSFPVFDIGPDSSSMQTGYLNAWFEYGLWEPPFKGEDTSSTRQWWSASFLSKTDAWRQEVAKIHDRVTDQRTIKELINLGYSLQAYQNYPMVEVVIICSLNELMSSAVLIDLVTATADAMQPPVTTSLIAAIDNTGGDVGAIATHSALYELASFSCTEWIRQSSPASEDGREEQPWEKAAGGKSGSSGKAFTDIRYGNYSRLLPGGALHVPSYRNVPFDRIFMTAGPGEYESGDGEKISGELCAEFLYHLVYNDLKIPSEPVKTPTLNLLFSSFGIAKVEVPIDTIFRYFVSRSASDALRLMVEGTSSWYDFSKTLNEVIAFDDNVAKQKDVEPAENDGSLRELAKDPRVVPQARPDYRAEAVKLVENAIKVWLFRRLNLPIQEKGKAGGAKIGKPRILAERDPVRTIMKLLEEKLDSKLTEKRYEIDSLNRKLSLDNRKLLRPPKKKEERETVDKFIESAEADGGEDISAAPTIATELERHIKQHIKEAVLDQFGNPSPKLSKAAEWVLGVSREFGFRTEDDSRGETSETESEEAETSGVPLGPFASLEKLIAEGMWGFLASEAARSESDVNSARQALILHVERPGMSKLWIWVAGIAGFLSGFFAIPFPFQLPGAVLAGFLLAYIAIVMRGAPHPPGGLAGDYIRAYEYNRMVKRLLGHMDQFRESFLKAMPVTLNTAADFCTNAFSSIENSANELHECGLNALEKLEEEHEAFTHVQCYPPEYEKTNILQLMHPRRAPLDASTLQGEYFSRILPAEKVAALLERLKLLYSATMLTSKLDDDPRPAALYRYVMGSILSDKEFKDTLVSGWGYQRLGEITATADANVHSEGFLAKMLVSTSEEILRGILLDLEVRKAVLKEYPDEEKIDKFIQSIFRLCRPELRLVQKQSNQVLQAAVLMPKGLVPQEIPPVKGESTKEHDPADLFGLLLSELDREGYREDVHFIRSQSKHLFMVFLMNHGLKVIDVSPLASLGARFKSNTDFAGMDVFPGLDYGDVAGGIEINSYNAYYNMEHFGIRVEKGIGSNSLIVSQFINTTEHPGMRSLIEVAREYSKFAESDREIAMGLFDYLLENSSTTKPEEMSDPGGTSEDLNFLYLALARMTGLDVHITRISVDTNGEKSKGVCVAVRLPDSAEVLVDYNYDAFDVKHEEYKVFPSYDTNGYLKGWTRKLRKYYRQHGNDFVITNNTQPEE